MRIKNLMRDAAMRLIALLSRVTKREGAPPLVSGAYTLMYFGNDNDNKFVIVYGGSQSDKVCQDFSIHLRKDEFFGSIPYKQLVKAERGTILWNNKTRTGEILFKNDPRWEIVFPPSKAQHHEG